MPNLLELCREKKRELDTLRPIDREQEARILQKFRLEWDYHSNNLEGNSLSYGETRALILHGLTAQGKPLKDHFEVTGHHDAVLWVEDLVRKQAPLTEAIIRQLHQLILKQDHFIEAMTEDGRPTRLLVEVGKYKSSANHVVTSTGEVLFFSSPLDTPLHMQELVQWYDGAKEGDPIEVAAVFHHRLTRIHPFTDGNGRVARLVSNFILMMNGYPPVIIKTQEKSEYFAALAMADGGEPGGFAEYLASRLLASLDLVIRGARGEDIDEVDDIRKEVALLKQQFESTARVNILKSPALAQSAWSDWIEPLFRLFEKGSAQFAEFYLQRHVHLVVHNQATSGTLEDQLTFVGQRIASSDEVSLSLMFAQVRSRQHLSQSFTQALALVLRDTHIEIHNGLRQKIAEVDWDTTPTREQLRDWIAAEERRHLAFLKPLIQNTL